MNCTTLEGTTTINPKIKLKTLASQLKDNIGDDNKEIVLFLVLNSISFYVVS